MKSLVTLALLIGLLPTTLYAQLRLPALVSDGMVIQRDQKVKVWGWAGKGIRVSVDFQGEDYEATTGDDGKWMVSLKPSTAGGPHTMTIAAENETITLKDILVGDVWLCAGQSNMVHYLDLHRDRYQEDIDKANHAAIRQFLVPTNPVLTGPAEDFSGGAWLSATPANVPRFSVIAYFFARDLHERYKVPIGIINASVGGTPVEAWTSEAGLQQFPNLVETLTTNKDTAYVYRVKAKAAAAQRAIWERRKGDAGMDGAVKWYDPAYEPEGWKTISIPGYWEDQGISHLDGIVWYRRVIDVPASMVGVPAMIAMGRIVDADNVYINGTLVGGKTYQYPQRRYQIPAGVLKPGMNTITVRVANYAGKGGFVPDKPYYLASDNDTVDLTGYWHYKVGRVFEPETRSVRDISLIHQPTSLFNGMIAPGTDYAVKGFVWYQGESNADTPHTYEPLLTSMIRDWRIQWGQGEIPFLYVQLPNFMEVNYLPSESQWAELREAQRRVLDEPNTAMVVAIDLGEWNDIHPGNKKPIGDRLALAARKIAYGEKDVIHSGPTFAAAEVDANRVTLHFTNTGGGLVSSDGKDLRWIAVAGADRRFVWAHAKIDGNTVVVWHDDVPFPAYVRYAWADNPHPVNFYNKAGLPASPFQARLTDTSKLWHGKKAAVVLTYDDALAVHLDHAIPVLDSLGFNATFYLSVAFPGCKDRMEDWRQVASRGHELGNHTWFHPCDGAKPGRSWVSPDNDLGAYSTKEIVREIEMTNAFLKSLDGKGERTFAYTCGDTDTGDGSFINEIADKFVAMRGVNGQLNTTDNLNLKNVSCYVVDERNADQLTVWAAKARDENALLVVLFHGVGGGHALNVDLKQHNQFLAWLKAHEGDFWVTTMIEAANHWRHHQPEN